jgi:hypothetical protein
LGLSEGLGWRDGSGEDCGREGGRREGEGLWRAGEEGWVVAVVLMLVLREDHRGRVGCLLDLGRGFLGWEGV